MDELEFIMGPVTSPFGALRASLGYPEPWTIKYVEIGNEDNLGGSDASYIAYRFKAYYDAISAKYPDIIIISSTGDTSVQMGNSATDFHEYTRPDQFVSQFGYWDNLANREHLTLIGEYANIQWNLPYITGVDWSAPKLPFPMWVGAVAETVFSLGAERNGYGIIGMSYAPGFQNVNSWEWSVRPPPLF
jgi:alpha-N-arabinofuranosidase